MHRERRPEPIRDAVAAAVNGDPLTAQVIGCAIKVHKALGPGLIESCYEECLAFEIEDAGLPVERQLALPVTYRGRTMQHGYRIDLLVDRRLIIEVKAVEIILPVHEAQLLTYLRLSQIHVGLLMNFCVPVLKDGIKRLSL